VGYRGKAPVGGLRMGLGNKVGQSPQKLKLNFVNECLNFDVLEEQQ